MKLGIGNYEAIVGAQLLGKIGNEKNTRREGQVAQHGKGTNGLFHSGGGFRSRTFITNQGSAGRGCTFCGHLSSKNCEERWCNRSDTVAQFAARDDYEKHEIKSLQLSCRKVK